MSGKRGPRPPVSQNKRQPSLSREITPSSVTQEGGGPEQKGDIEQERQGGVETHPILEREG